MLAILVALNENHKNVRWKFWNVSNSFFSTVCFYLSDVVSENICSGKAYKIKKHP